MNDTKQASVWLSRRALIAGGIALIAQPEFAVAASGLPDLG